MKFSILITTYNRVNLLRRAVESALGQTVPCEVIVVDNASTDDTRAYVESLGDRVLYHRNATNTNHSGAVNAGASLATGDWIKLVDDDDYLADTCIEAMTHAIAQRPQAVICSCLAIQVDGQGSPLSRTPPRGPSELFYVPQAAIHYGMLIEQVPFGTPIQVAVRRDAFLQSGCWDLSMTSCDDIDSWVRVTEHGDALFLDRYLAYRTMWPGGYDQKIALLRRRDTNALIKQRIYDRISAAYRDRVPTLDVVNDYLSLHWGLVALKQRRPGAAYALGFPAVMSPAAWRLFCLARSRQTTLVPKIPLA